MPEDTIQQVPAQQPVNVQQARPNTTEDQEVIGCWDYTINGVTPKLNLCVAIICLICNIIIPGLGTAISSCSKTASNNRCYILIIALVQFAFAWFIVPWIWSIVWGILLVVHATDDSYTEEYATSRGNAVARPPQQANNAVPLENTRTNVPA